MSRRLFTARALVERFLGDWKVPSQIPLLLSTLNMGRLFQQPMSVHIEEIALNYSTAEAGNPFVRGWYADPDTAVYNGTYWVYATSSYDYDKQTYFDAFSSPDMIKWTKHTNIMTIADVHWANRAVWAPSPAYRNGKYYLYFGANDIQEDEDEQGVIGGIGVAVADHPQGPYVDAIGKPLIGHYHHGAQPIDQDIFMDDDGQAYIYYGGHGHANVAKVNEDMITLGALDEGATFRSITPTNYVEGSQMLKRNGTYYFMWSEGGWGLPDYSVSYAMSKSPLGPFKRKDKILQQDSAVAKSSGHHGVINEPGTDIYYIVYHRRPLSETDANHRVLAYDRMFFNEDGSIEPVKMLVKDNFADGDMIAWKTYEGDWEVRHQALYAATQSFAIAAMDTNFADLLYEAVVSLHARENSTGTAGLFFRANVKDYTAKGLSGYLVDISGHGNIQIRRIDDGISTNLATIESRIDITIAHKILVEAKASTLKVSVSDLTFEVSDHTYSHGTNGVLIHGAVASISNVSISTL